MQQKQKQQQQQPHDYRYSICFLSPCKIDIYSLAGWLDCCAVPSYLVGQLVTGQALLLHRVMTHLLDGRTDGRTDGPIHVLSHVEVLSCSCFLASPSVVVI